MKRIIFALILTLGGGLFLFSQAPRAKIKVLILTGINNHDWRTTTPVLREILEKTGKFQVFVDEDPNGAGPETFAPYDVLLLNYNDYKQTQGPWWENRTREAMTDFVRNGKGLVSYHASNNAFWGWPEFDRIVGGTWRETAGHGPYHKYTVKIMDSSDPIMAGMPPTFTETDELYHSLSMQPGIHLLASAYDDPANCWKKDQGCGTGKDEPLIWTTQYGVGRVFQTALGHDVKAMQSLGFQSTLVRGTEWAATGKVTIPVMSGIE